MASSLRSFEKGDFILQYAGDLITKKEITEREMKYARRSAQNKYSQVLPLSFQAQRAIMVVSHVSMQESNRIIVLNRPNMC